MKLKSFLKLVEIQTKVASVFPFLIGTLAIVCLYGQLNAANFFIMLGSLLSIDMATTAINNYMDYRKVVNKTTYGYNHHNAIVSHQLSIRSVEVVIISLLIIGTGLGVWLVSRTDLVVLIVGALAFAVGISYTFGPFPISRTPFGELVSGIAMGFGIPFLAMYVQLDKPDWIVMNLAGSYFNVSLNWYALIRVLWLSMPLVIGTGNIMFANNICDMADDLSDGRFTLVISLGKNTSLKLFRSAYLLAYASLLLGVLLKVLPLTSLIALGSIFTVWRYSGAFVEEPLKSKTFILAVKSFMQISLWLLLAWLIEFFI